MPIVQSIHRQNVKNGQNGFWQNFTIAGEAGFFHRSLFTDYSSKLVYIDQQKLQDYYYLLHF